MVKEPDPEAEGESPSHVQKVAPNHLGPGCSVLQKANEHPLRIIIPVALGSANGDAPPDQHREHDRKKEPGPAGSHVGFLS